VASQSVREAPVIAYGWLAWLILFLCYEIPAAIAECIYARRGQWRPITLSRNVWRWLGIAKGQEWRPYRRWRQAAVFVFLQVLAFHLAFATPGGAWVIASAIPVAIVIGYAVLVEDRRKGTRVSITVDTSRVEAAIAQAQRELDVLIGIERVNAQAKLEHAEHIRADEESERASARARVTGHLRKQFAAHDAAKGGK